MIKLDDINYIYTDQYNFVLVMHHENEVGKMLGTGKVVVNKYSTIKSYYGTLSQALMAYCNDSLKDVVGDIKDVLKAIEALETITSTLLKTTNLTDVQKESKVISS